MKSKSSHKNYQFKSGFVTVQQKIVHKLKKFLDTVF